MKKSLDEAEQEIKRVDHLIYVSLKYTRTVDVLRNVINRMIGAFDASMVALLEFLREKNEISDYPKSPGLRYKILKEQFKSEQEFTEYLDFYILLRELARAEYARREEFRRHVTMIAKLRNRNVEIDIDTVTEYYKKAKTFVKLVRDYILNNGGESLSSMLPRVIMELEFDRRYYS